MALDVDLSQLAIDRSTRQPSKPAHRRRWVTRYLLPLALLVAFAGLLGWATWEQLLPSRPVTVVPVIVARAEVYQAGTPLFQAAGWVEPRPRLVLVSTFASGVVEEMLVVEGDEVSAGQPVARLVDVDVRLAVQQAQAALRLREAEWASAQAELESARARLARPVHLETAVAEAETLLAKAEGELASLPLELQAAESRERFARQRWENRQAAGAAMAGRLVQESQSEMDSAVAQANQLRQRRTVLEREIAAQRRKRDALSKQRELKIEETQAVAAGEAKVRAALARTEQAKLDVQAAELQLERTVIKAPARGRVLEVFAQPGSHLAGMGAGATNNTSNVVSLYDPRMLQVRADVRLEDVPLVESGQRVEIKSALASEAIEGKVLSATSRANVQKNTLEVKVAITAPPVTIRPEMLVQVTFLATEKPGDSSPKSQEQERLLIPRPLVEGTPPASLVWVADPANRARRQAIKLGKAGTDQLVEVVEGLHVTDKLIAGSREGLTDGQRIRIVGEDSSIGIRASSGKGSN
jgi:multidrug efflux pump subunit AcrA (membrane-fusion protein)